MNLQPLNRLTYVGRYNIDNTFDIYPVFGQKRWERYRRLKHLKESAQKELNETLWYHDLNGVIENFQVRKLSSICDTLVHSKNEMELIHPSYERKNKKSDGFTLNKNANKKVKYMMSLLHQKLKKHKRNMGFYTFTTTESNFKYEPKKHDNIVSIQFQKLIKNLKKNYGLQYYVYVAERQDGKRLPNKKLATNRIHYHCVFIFNSTPPHVMQINYYWLNLLAEINFKTFNKDKLWQYVEFIDVQHLREKYYKAIINNDITKFYPFRGLNYNYNLVRIKGKLQKNPMNKILFAPVDVQPIFSHKKLAIYLAKYVTKSSDKIYARVWGACRELLTKVTQIVINDVYKIYKHLNYYVKKVYDVKQKTEVKKIYKNIIDIGKGFSFEYTKYVLNDEALMNGVFAKFRQSLMKQFDSELLESV